MKEIMGKQDENKIRRRKNVEMKEEKEKKSCVDKVFGDKETEERLKAESRIEGKKVHITDENERKNEIGERKNVGMKEEKD